MASQFGFFGKQILRQTLVFMRFSKECPGINIPGRHVEAADGQRKLGSAALTTSADSTGGYGAEMARQSCPTRLK